jgi:signal transduction histidine kinase
VDAGEIIRNFLPLLQNAVGHKAAISSDLPPTVCQIFIDSNQLQRVLLNLVINARDAITENGNIAIRLYEAHRPLNTGDNGLYVTIEVADDGVGMDGETRKKIFQPYFTTKGKSGTGLGMTIIQQIVTLAGGFVDIDSSFGKGTRIRIRLPRIGNARQ